MELVTKIENEKININNNKRRSTIIDINRNDFLKKFTDRSSSFSIKGMKDYLSTSPDEMDFYEVIKKTKDHSVYFY